jgi:hypothetical protein
LVAQSNSFPIARVAAVVFKLFSCQQLMITFVFEIGIPFYQRTANQPTTLQRGGHD